MPRPLRPRIPGGVFHVYTRGVRGLAIFVDDDDRAIFLALLGLIVVRYEWEVLGYCLMGNHYHLVVRTPHANLSEGMQQLNGRYAMLFNAKYGFNGHLFGGRFKHTIVEAEDDLERLLTYVEHNTVRHGTCRRATDWPWSSARRRNVPGRRAPVDLVTIVAYHSSTLDEASERFKRIVKSRWGTQARRPRGP